MSLTLPTETGGGDFTPPPEGTHPARCYRVVDLGTQQVEWMGTTKQQHKILVSWELPTELMEDAGLPFTIHERYTLSSSEKSNLRPMLEGWRGKKFEDSDFGEGGFHMRKLIGVPCLLTLVHSINNGKTYANVRGVVKPPKGMEVPTQINPSAFVSLDPEEFDQAAYDTLSDNLKQTIFKSPQYQQILNPVSAVQAPLGTEGGNGSAAEPFGDVPF